MQGIRDVLSPARSWLGQKRPLAMFLLLHAAAWTVYGTFALEGGVHDDMVEAWAWGKEFQLGYYKHPPLFAWVAGAWFSVFSRSDWAFQLLAALNGSLSVLAICWLARELTDPAKEATAGLLAMLTPIYGVLALKFNANSILMPIWPMATLFLVRSVRRGRLWDAVALGVLSALAVLGKYYSVLLLASFFVATLITPEGRRWWCTASPWIAALSGFIVVLPHVVWLVASGYPTFRYAGTKFQLPEQKQLQWTLVTALAPVLLLGPAALALRYVTRIGFARQLAALLDTVRSPDRAWLWVVACGPFVLTLAFGLLAGAKVSVSYTFPIFFLFPVLASAALPHLSEPGMSRRLGTAVIVVLVGVALASPLVGYVRTALDVRGAIEPRREVAVEAERRWREQFGTEPRLVAGSMAYAGSMPFYAASAPSHFVHFNHAWAPWVSRERLAHEGLLVLCESADHVCLQRAAALSEAPLPTIRLDAARVSHGHTGPAAEIVLMMLPPADRSIPRS